MTGFAELKKAESDSLLQFFKLHLHSADDHYVRWKWAVGSVAMWDNVRSYVSGSSRSLLLLITLKRTAVHRVIPGKYAANTRTGVRTTVFGEKRNVANMSFKRYLTKTISAYFDPNSEGRQERADRVAAEAQNGHSSASEKEKINGTNGTIDDK